MVEKKEKHILNEKVDTYHNKDMTMNKIIIHPPHGSFLMFVKGMSQDVNR